MIIYMYMILQMTIIIFPLTQRNVFRFRELLFTMSLKITGILSMPLTLRHCSVFLPVSSPVRCSTGLSQMNLSLWILWVALSMKPALCMYGSASSSSSLWKITTMKLYLQFPVAF